MFKINISLELIKQFVTMINNKFSLFLYMTK